MDPIHVPIGPVTWARAKKFKETLNAFIQCIWVEESLWRSKGDDKSVVQDWVFVVQALECDSWAKDRRIANLVELVDQIPRNRST